MERYIGLDVHAESCTLVVVSGTGRKLRQEVVETNGAALKQVMRAIPGPKRVCLEEGTQSAWLYELLRGEAEDVVVTMPSGRSGPKDDARDAAALAESLRTGTNLRRIYKRVALLYEGGLTGSEAGTPPVTPDLFRIPSDRTDNLFSPAAIARVLRS